LTNRSTSSPPVLDQWYEPSAIYFKVQSTEGKTYLPPYDEDTDEWTLHSGTDAGAYRTSDLPPGAYGVVVRFPGFKTGFEDIHGKALFVSPTPDRRLDGLKVPLQNVGRCRVLAKPTMKSELLSRHRIRHLKPDH